MCLGISSVACAEIRNLQVDANRNVEADMHHYNAYLNGVKVPVKIGIAMVNEIPQPATGVRPTFILPSVEVVLGKPLVDSATIQMTSVDTSGNESALSTSGIWGDATKPVSPTGVTVTLAP
jgi:hypothetical protein